MEAAMDHTKRGRGKLPKKRLSPKAAIRGKRFLRHRKQALSCDASAAQQLLPRRKHKPPKPSWTMPVTLDLDVLFESMESSSSKETNAEKAKRKKSSELVKRPYEDQTILGTGKSQTKTDLLDTTNRVSQQLLENDKREALRLQNESIAKESDAPGVFISKQFACLDHLLLSSEKLRRKIGRNAISGDLKVDRSSWKALSRKKRGIRCGGNEGEVDCSVTARAKVRISDNQKEESGAEEKERVAEDGEAVCKGFRGNNLKGLPRNFDQKGVPNIVNSIQKSELKDTESLSTSKVPIQEIGGRAKVIPTTQKELLSQMDGQIEVIVALDESGGRLSSRIPEEKKTQFSKSASAPNASRISSVDVERSKSLYTIEDAKTYRKGYLRGRDHWIRTKNSTTRIARKRTSSVASMQFIIQGLWATKHHYTQRSSQERWLYVSKDQRSLCWKRRWGLRESSISLDRVIGFLIGPKSRRYQQILSVEKNFLDRYSPWQCCSIVLNDRTIDLTFPADDVLLPWILALQKLAPNTLFKWHRSSIVRQIGWMKLRHAIKTKGMKQLVQQFRHVTKNLYQEHIRLTRSVWSHLPDLKQNGSSTESGRASVWELLRQQTDSLIEDGALTSLGCVSTVERQRPSISQTTQTSPSYPVPHRSGTIKKPRVPNATRGNMHKSRNSFEPIVEEKNPKKNETVNNNMSTETMKTEEN